VLILLYLKEEEWYLVLMKRTEYPGVHSKQVSLPGGLHEPTDPDLSSTALRETHEETGISHENVRLLGQLSKLEIPVSGIEVSPFIGYYQGVPEFNHEPGEVSYLIEVPLRELRDPENIMEDLRTIHCKLVKVPYYALQGEKVWGATAMILSEFTEILRRMK
jgi:8-oxo-dGTP pyrophosphatase MutT (NUDIX family)